MTINPEKFLTNYVGMFCYGAQQWLFLRLV